MSSVQRSRWVWILVAGLVALLVLIVVAIQRAGPDHSVVGTVTHVEPHELCVAPAGEEPRCAHVDYPGEVAGIDVGDCVRATRSAEGILESVHRTEQCG